MTNEKPDVPNTLGDDQLSAFWDKQKQNDLYRVNDTPIHVHNGTDAPQIDYSDITGKYYVTAHTIVGTAAATSGNYNTFFTALFPCIVMQISEVHSVAGTAGGGCSVKVEKLTSGTAPGSGILLNNAAFDLQSTINTPVFAKLLDGSLKGTYTTTGNSQVRDVSLATGDRLALKLTGTPTTVSNVTITVYMLIS